jgi:hypothetical protein
MRDTQELLQKIDLRSLVESYTQLQGGPKEFFGSCPKCGGNDRFHFRPDKGFFCRTCTGDPSSGGWHDALDFIQLVHGVNFIEAYEMLNGGSAFVLSPELIAERDARQAREDEERRAKQERQRAKLERSGAWAEYHANLEKLNAYYLWEERGLTRQWADYFGVGFSLSRKFYYGEEKFHEGASLTIPTFRVELAEQEEDTPPLPVLHCVNLVHRVMGDNPPCGKYRPHLSEVGKALFQTDLAGPGMGKKVFLVEGEIKAMVTYSKIFDFVDEHLSKGFGVKLLGNISVVGTAGAGFKRESAEELKDASEIFICFDPDASREAENAAGILGRHRCRIVELPGKIDDMLVEGSLTPGDLYELLTISRRA